MGVAPSKKSMQPSEMTSFGVVVGPYAAVTVLALLLHGGCTEKNRCKTYLGNTSIVNPTYFQHYLNSSQLRMPACMRAIQLTGRQHLECHNANNGVMLMQDVSYTVRCKCIRWAWLLQSSSRLNHRGSAHPICSYRTAPDTGEISLAVKPRKARERAVSLGKAGGKPGESRGKTSEASRPLSVALSFAFLMLSFS